jgi:hypothetical protein
MGAFSGSSFSGSSFSVDAVAAASAAAASAPQPIDLIARALRRLPHQYYGTGPDAESNTQKMLRALLAPAAALQTAMLDVIAQTITENAVGVQLTEIGELVGRPREGVTDDDIYRRYVNAQISANKSDGLVEDHITVALLVVGDDDATIEVENTGAATTNIRVMGVAITEAVADVLVELIGKATADGVRAIVGYTTGDPDDQMIWGAGTWGQNWSRSRNAEQ